MSSFYLDVLKDRLYTFGKDSLARRSAQTAICEITFTLTKILTPILTFTTEELWQCLSKILGVKDTETVMLHRWPKIERKWISLILNDKMKRLNKIRNVTLKAIENEREKGLIRSSLEAKVCLYTEDVELFQFLKRNLDMLVTIFIVSDVSADKVTAFPDEVLRSPDIPHLGIKVEKIDFPKCTRCWNYRSSVGGDSKYPLLCQRCVEVIEGRK
jgi:isoleucyl-tRNA synthetase